MQPIARNLPATRPSQPSTAVSLNSQRPKAERLVVARAALSALMKGRPDTNAENPKYLAEMVESLAYLEDHELAWLTDPRDGLQTVCKYLPTPADVHGFLRDRRARAEQFKPAPTAWRKLEDDPNAPWNQETDVERKKRLVRELLGYNPGESSASAKRTLETPTAEDVANLKLKTPPAPPSRYLIETLEKQGYPFIPKPRTEAA